MKSFLRYGTFNIIYGLFYTHLNRECRISFVEFFIFQRAVSGKR